MENPTLEIVNCKKALQPAIDILKIFESPHIPSLNEPDFIDALQAVGVLPIIQSVPLVNRILELVFSASALGETNPKVLNICEQIILQLMATDMLNVKM